MLRPQMMFTSNIFVADLPEKLNSDSAINVHTCNGVPGLSAAYENQALTND